MEKEIFKDFAIDKVKKEYPFILEADNFNDVLNKFSYTFKNIESSLGNVYNLNIESNLKINIENGILNNLYSMFISAIENSNSDNKKLINFSISKGLFEKFILNILKNTEVSNKAFLKLNKNILAEFYIELLENLIDLDEKNKRVFYHPDEYRLIDSKSKLECLLKANLKFDNILKLENVNMSTHVYKYGDFSKSKDINRDELFNKFLTKLFTTNYGHLIISDYLLKNKKYAVMIEEIGLENIIKDNLFKSLCHKSLYRIFDNRLNSINLAVLSDFYYDSKLVNDKILLDNLLNQMPSDFKNTLNKYLIKYVNKTYFKKEE